MVSGRYQLNPSTSSVKAVKTAFGISCSIEMDRIGDGGLKVTEGTVSKIDRGGKTLAVKTADGAEATFKITDHAVVDAGKDVGKGVEKASKVTVYYTEEGGKKIVHFFKNN